MTGRRAFHILWFGLIAAACSGAPAPRITDPAHASCASGDLAACQQYADRHDTTTPEGRRRALVVHQYACFLDHQPSCAALARLYGQDPGSSKSRLVDALESSCEAGEPEACVQLARRSNRRRARELYTRACDADFAPGCRELAELVRRGWMVDANMVAAVNLYEKACDLGDAAGCVEAGKAYLFGSGVPPDVERGLELLEPTCSGDTTVGCEPLAKIWEQGIGVEADLAKASTYYDRAQAEEQEPAELSRASAYLVFVDACANGDPLGCFDAGWFRAQGDEVSWNLTLSREFFQLACRDGVQSACNRWETITPSGRMTAATEAP